MRYYVWFSQIRSHIDLVLQIKQVLEKVLISVSLAWYKPVIPRVLV